MKDPAITSEANIGPTKLYISTSDGMYLHLLVNFPSFSIEEWEKGWSGNVIITAQQTKM